VKWQRKKKIAAELRRGARAHPKDSAKRNIEEQARRRKQARRARSKKRTSLESIVVVDIGATTPEELALIELIIAQSNTIAMPYFPGTNMFFLPPHLQNERARPHLEILMKAHQSFLRPAYGLSKSNTCNHYGLGGAYNIFPARILFFLGRITRSRWVCRGLRGLVRALP